MKPKHVQDAAMPAVKRGRGRPRKFATEPMNKVLGLRLPDHLSTGISKFIEKNKGKMDETDAVRELVTRALRQARCLNGDSNTGGSSMGSAA